jgi:hypothetical protein
MNYIYKLFGGDATDPLEIFKNIPWSKINSLTADSPELTDIFKKLYNLQTVHHLSLDQKQLSLVSLYLKTITKKLPKDMIDKLKAELAQQVLSKPAEVAPSKPAEVAVLPELKSIEPLMSEVCNRNRECKNEFNGIDWKLLPTLKKEDPKTKETLDQLEHLKSNFLNSFDKNTQQLVNLYIKILRKRLDLTIETPQTQKKVSTNTIALNKYCKPFYLDGNRFNCIGTSVGSDDDKLRCVFNPNKVVNNNINNMDLDTHCENNPDYKSKYLQASI